MKVIVVFTRKHKEAVCYNGYVQSVCHFPVRHFSVRQIPTDRGAVWAVGSHGPKASCITWESRSPIWGGNFWWIGAPIVNYRHLLPWAVQKRLNRSIYCLGCGLQWAEGCTNSIVFGRWGLMLMCHHGRTRCRRLSNTTEPSVYGGDAPYVKLLWPLVIFGHAHLDSRIDSQALRAEYCIVDIPHNTAI